MKLMLKLKEHAKRNLSEDKLLILTKWYQRFIKLQQFIYTMYGKIVKNRFKMWINSKKDRRYLEIGPGSSRIPGFETLDVVGGPNVDYVYDASKKLPFKDNTFDLIYASHVLEHIPWYKTEEVLKEWVRILKPGGVLEVWVPDGFRICKALVEYELGKSKEAKKAMELDGWYKFNPRKDIYVWVNGRIFTYGDGTGNTNHPNWHRAIFTPQYLKNLFKKVGLINIEIMDRSEVRGYDHGWINLGVRGVKPERWKP